MQFDWSRVTGVTGVTGKWLLYKDDSMNRKFWINFFVAVFNGFSIVDNYDVSTVKLGL